MRTELKLLFALSLSAATLSAETKILEGFTLIDGTGKAAQADSSMIVTDGRIQPGMLVCFTSLGSGLHWGAALYRA